MNKEKENLLNKLLSEPDVPYLVSKKSINRLMERMKPETQDMKAYLIAYYSAETSAESQTILKAKYASMTPAVRRLSTSPSKRLETTTKFRSE